MSGFAVVDIETTGLHPRYGDRVVEIAVVHVSATGEITGTWDTVLNPGVDLGPESIYGVSAAEVRDAPGFEAVAGRLVGLLSGRALVAHNHSYVSRFLAAEFRRCGYEVPVPGVCTMLMARNYVGPSRSLVACGHCFELEIREARCAVKARATAQLLAAYLDLDPGAPQWKTALTKADMAQWPAIPRSDVPWQPRTASAPGESFLTSLVHRLEDPELSTRVTRYFGTLDRALLDGHFSAGQAVAVDEVADELGIGRIESDALNALYLRDLARIAWADGVITDDERTALRAVGELLSAFPGEVDNVLADTRPSGATMAVPVPAQGQGLSLQDGDLVVFAGEMSCPHSQLEELARGAGLTPHPSVTKRVTFVVAADPGALTGKVRKAHDLGIPVVTEAGFRQLVGLPTPRDRRAG